MYVAAVIPQSGQPPTTRMTASPALASQRTSDSPQSSKRSMGRRSASACSMRASIAGFRNPGRRRVLMAFERAESAPRLVAQEHVLDDRKGLEDFLRMEKWIFDSPDLAGEAFRQFIKQFYQGNGFVNGGIAIATQQATPATHNRAWA